MNKVDRPYTIKAAVNLTTIIIDLLSQPKMFNPYWQIMENSFRIFSEIFIFRVVTQAILLEN